jgi:RNA polymerase sigma factor (sigma-70 family)
MASSKVKQDSGMGADRDPGQTMTPELLTRLHAPAVLAVCLACTRNIHDAEDATQDTLVRAIANIHQLREPGRTRAWLLQIARRVCADGYRRRQDAAAIPEHIAAAGRTIDPRLERLQAALSQLPEEYREPISLFYLVGRSTGDVAHMLGISEPAARQRLCRGRLMLYDLLGGEEP